MLRLPPLEVETARLVIRPSDPGTAAELRLLLADPRVAEPYFGCSNPTERRAQARPWVQSEHDWTQRSLLTLSVRARAAGMLVGAVRFDHGRLSYLVNPRYWRQGYGAEMVRACCLCAQRDLGLDELHANVIRENFGSRRILEGAGFVFAGLMPRDEQGHSSAVTILRYLLHARAAAVSTAQATGGAVICTPGPANGLPLL